ncbi:MAG: hypothetical protein ABSG65_22060 [Bryobacteraceae bacterium]
MSGVVLGGFANRLVTAGPPNRPPQPPSRAELRKQYIQDMRNRLHLNEAQVTQLQQIADATGQRMHDMHKSIEDEHVQKVIGILDDSQKAEYAKWRDEREKHRLEQAKK